MIGKMRRLFNIYILVLLALGVACQRVDLPDNPHGDQPAELPLGAIGSKATITFSTAELLEPETRGVVDPNVRVETLHLIVFDENGMLVEVCEATELGSSDHDGHTGGRNYTVTLTVTDEPRIIHYVANCDVDQVVYGHETSVIGNMFVDRNDSEGAETEYEVSYWARIEVPYILVEEIEEKQADGTFKKVLSLVGDIKDAFMHVPLLRNYAEITVTDDFENKDDTFKVEGFIVYNLLNRGTVAPYNSNTQQFQSFFERDGQTITKKYLYPEMYKEFHYEGHALTSAQLITDLVRNPDGTIKEFKPGEPFYVYERKVSVMTDEEEKWRESPPHIIIKARYSDDGDAVKETDPVYYYKMDLVYTEKDAQGTEEVKYYNILRNFQYDFNITKIHDVGYDSWEKAVDGAAGNNISGSSTTSKLTNISDDDGRLWVSYTDITLVTGEDVVFRYKYIPNYYGTEGSEYAQGAVRNDLVHFQNIKGDVITGIDKGDEKDAADGWREVTIHVNEPSNITRQQILYLKTNNSNLNRQIRHTLRKKLTMQVEATPKVLGQILQPVKVDIKLPPGMTEDMFPLALNMETEHRTLSPDATANDDPIPVTAGPSIVTGRVGESSYYYTVTIPTFDAYNALPKDGDMRVVTTHWRTNMAANASTFYVANKYFNQASDSWENYKYVFSNAQCSSSAVGVGEAVTISFTMADGAINKQVTITLEGMTYSGTLNGVTYTNAKTFTYTTSSKNVTISEGLKTTTATDAVSFTLDADDYNIASAEGSRQTYTFNGAFGAASLEAEADVEVDFTFNISDDALEALRALYPDAVNAGVGVPMYVTLDRLHPADDQLIYSQAKAGGDRYIYRIKNAGKQTIKLATIEDVGGPCTVTLQADYFDTDSVTIRQKGMEFRSLALPASVQWGTGKAVNITFQLAAGDSNRDVTVALENMARGGNTTLKFNTGNSGGIVTNNNGTYTITNVVTTSDYATLKVSISASGYDNKEMTIQQNKTEFRSLTIPNSVTEGAGRAVNITFQLAEGDSNRDVTVVLENMARNGETTLTFNTGNSNIVTNNNGTYTITDVVTTGADTAILKVTISATGYENKVVTCGNRPSQYSTGTISFANAGQRTIRNNNQQVWQNAGITLTNDKNGNRNTNVSSDVNPVRFYQNHKLTIKAPGVIKSITFDCYSSYYINYADDMETSIGTLSGATVKVSNDKVTVEFTAANATEFVVDNLAAEVRMDSLSVTYLNAN